MKKRSGILRNRKCRDLFEWINQRPYCKRCWRERREFNNDDKKHNNSYSNLIPGFSSSSVKPPIDVLIIAESHGGGREESFKKQKDLSSEIENISSYYMDEKLEKYHQMQMRSLLQKLDKRNKSWIFTDLIKCYIWKKPKKNVEKAIEHCSKYLEEQIKILKPKTILVLGNLVARAYFRGVPNVRNLKHGETVQLDDGSKLVWSYFPSGNTADIWVRENGWVSVLRNLKL